MTAPEFLLILNERGISVNPTGDKLRIWAPKGTLTHELQEEITAMKPQLQAFLGCNRGERLEQVAAEVNRLWDELQEIGERLGQYHPSFDEQLAKCTAKLAEYKAISDLMMNRA